MKPFIVLIGAIASLGACDPPRSAVVALDRSMLAFHGTVLTIKEIQGFREPQKGLNGKSTRVPWHGQVITFEVWKIWKGPVGNRITLHILPMREDDGYEHFKEGQVFIVFASSNGSYKNSLLRLTGVTYGTSQCSGTVSTSHPLEYQRERVKSYLRELGPGRLATDPPQ